MKFSNIGALLERYEKLFHTHIGAKEFVQQVIFDETGITIPLERIIVKDGIAAIEGKTILKNELFMKRAGILLKLKEKKIYEIK
jgi:hypothetical protein